jgi:hypothetical protein
MMPEWIKEWILKDRLVRNKFRISREYLRHPKSIQFVDGEKDKDTGEWVWFRYMVNSKKYGKYWVKYERERYKCNCPFFKHRLICSHILAVCQKTNIWPKKETIFPSKSQK